MTTSLKTASPAAASMSMKKALAAVNTKRTPAAAADALKNLTTAADADVAAASTKTAKATI